MIAWAVWWSNPRQGTIAGEGADPQNGIDFYPVWEPANGTAPNRMHHGDRVWGQDWYQALWHRPDGDHLVVVFRGPVTIHMFYDYWRIVVLDQSMHVVRMGQVGLNGNPFELIEIKAADASLPLVVRDKWEFGVRWQLSQAQPADGTDPGSERSPKFAESWVEWDDGPKLPREVWKSTNLTIRSAEAVAGTH